MAPPGCPDFACSTIAADKTLMLSAARAAGDDDDCGSMWFVCFLKITKVEKAGRGLEDVIKSTIGFCFSG
jgi:hypothetical protein